MFFSSRVFEGLLISYYFVFIAVMNTIITVNKTIDFIRVPISKFTEMHHQIQDVNKQRGNLTSYINLYNKKYIVTSGFNDSNNNETPKPLIFNSLELYEIIPLFYYKEDEVALPFQQHSNYNPPTFKGALVRINNNSYVIISDPLHYTFNENGSQSSLF